MQYYKNHDNVQLQAFQICMIVSRPAYNLEFLVHFKLLQTALQIVNACFHLSWEVVYDHH